MISRRAVALCVATITALPCAAQVSGVAMTPQAAFESFVRVTATLGQPASALQRMWPTTLEATTVAPSLALTAAQRVSVAISDPTPRDSVRRVVRAHFTDVVADTLALRAHVHWMQARLHSLLGGPDLCSTPMGDPAQLHAAQSVARVWSRGLAGQETELHWEVTPGGPYLITVTAGHAASRGVATLACNARMP